MLSAGRREESSWALSKTSYYYEVHQVILVKMMKSDLKEWSSREAFSFGVVGAALGMLFLFVILYFIPQIAFYKATFWIGGKEIDLFYLTIIPFIPGFVISGSKRLVILRLRFNVVYRIRQLGQRLLAVSLGLFVIPIAAFVAVSLMYPNTATSPYLGQMILAGLLVLPVGTAVNYCGDVFTSNQLAALCFRQAMESKDRISKGKWITRALEHVREYASEFREEMYTSEFQHLFAIRLLQGENVDTDLENISKSLTNHSSLITTFNEIKNRQQAFSFITARKTVRERLRSHFEEANKYATLLGAIAAILITLATLLRQK